MSNQAQAHSFTLEPTDNERLANLCGQFDGHLRQIESRLGVEINNRGNTFNVIGDQTSIAAAGEVLKELYAETEMSQLTAGRVHLFLQEAGVDAKLEQSQQQESIHEVIITTRKGKVKGRGHNQQRYMENVLTHDINFGVGPAGTGKTYLAVACAVEALEKEIKK